MTHQVFYQGAKISYSDQGSGRALVFLHGYLLSYKVWLDFTRPFEQSFRVICIDLPGHGDSDVVDDVSTMEVMAGAVEAVLKQAGIQKAIIFGHSMGGYAALALLEKRPDLFTAICLFHSHPNADALAVREKRDREVLLIEQGHKNLLFSQSIPNMFATDRLEEHQDQLEFCKSLARNMSNRAVKAAILGLKSRADRSRVLAQADCPCLNIAGRLDNFISLEEVALKVKLPAGSQVLICEKTGHMGFYEEPEFIRAGILQFLKSSL